MVLIMDDITKFCRDKFFYYTKQPELLTIIEFI